MLDYLQAEGRGFDSGFSSFLPHSKDMHVRWIGNSKIDRMCVNGQHHGVEKWEKTAMVREQFIWIRQFTIETFITAANACSLDNPLMNDWRLGGMVWKTAEPHRLQVEAGVGLK